jgi:hypothetical protein
MGRRRADIPSPGCRRCGRRVAVTAITSFVVQRSSAAYAASSRGACSRASVAMADISLAKPGSVASFGGTRALGPHSKDLRPRCLPARIRGEQRCSSGRHPGPAVSSRSSPDECQSGRHLGRRMIRRPGWLAVRFWWVVRSHGRAGRPAGSTASPSPSSTLARCRVLETLDMRHSRAARLIGGGRVFGPLIRGILP